MQAKLGKEMGSVQDPAYVARGRQRKGVSSTRNVPGTGTDRVRTGDVPRWQGTTELYRGRFRDGLQKISNISNERTVIAVIRAAIPSFRNDHNKVAFAIHATLLSVGFVLTAIGPSALGNNVFSSTSTDEVGIDNWNEFKDHYAFVYTNPEKGSKKVLVKCLVMNKKLFVETLAENSSQPLHLEIEIEAQSSWCYN
ncbi:probable proteasome inhibitor [Hibiscus syriacus]|uniref:probable proteasome inhibitor n=1 Tax=Hibiscus syriacus TaxID=106335 RepID=UPI001920733A|nr:probable proteasome inhibitor [Hibiscus syriacus]